MREIKNCYFKDFNDGAGPYISGLTIPKDADGVCRGYRFIDCDFHAGCSVPYENCEFVGCSGTPNRYNERGL